METKRGCLPLSGLLFQLHFKANKLVRLAHGALAAPGAAVFAGGPCPLAGDWLLLF